MNLLAYFLITGHGLSGPLLWIINIVILLLVALILWQIVKWAAAEFGVPGKIVQLVGILLFLMLILSLFAGCSSLTPQQSPLLAQAKPIADIAIETAAARYGVSPATTKLVIDNLYGAAAAVQASQPAKSGTNNAVVGNAIATSLPAGTPNAQAALLQAAAASLTSRTVQPAPTP